MKISKKFILVGSLPFLLAACADESPFENSSTKKGEGKIKLSLSSSSEVKTAIPQFRSETTEIVAPPVSLFQIRLSKTDGSYAKTWSNIDEFAKETEFSVGQYSLEAYYGSSDSQGFINPSDKGYEHAYYYGITEDIMVMEDQETPVQISASLANSIVWVEYTEAFTHFFRSWNTILKTAGKEDVEIGQQSGKSFVSTGTVDIVMDAILENGNPVFLNPAEFMAEPQHMYKITYDVFKGENDIITLSLTFNDDPEEVHNVTIELTDEVVNADPPVVSLVGSETSKTIETQVGTPISEEIQYEVIAKGGIAKAMLKVSSDTYKSSFLDNGQIDLCNATESQQKAMIQAGINARGFFKNPETMAFLDLTEFCKNLPEGTHEISLLITDKNTNVNDSESPTVKIISVNTNSEILSTEAIFGNNYADITIAYDGPDPTQNGANPFSFKFIIPRTGIEYPVEIKAIGTETNPLTKATYVSHNYVYRVALPEEEADSYPIRMYFNGGSEPVDDTHSVDITYPEYKVEYDAFAKWMRLRVAGLENDANKIKLYTERLRVFVDGEEKEVSKDLQTGIISFEGLNSDSDYKLKTTLQLQSEADKFSAETIVSTEKEVDVPNNDFSVTKTLKIDPINVGGKYIIWFIAAKSYQITSSINRIVPAGDWASLNELTCYDKAVTNNTWCKVPSTFLEDGKVIIRTVGYTHNALNVDETKNKTNTNYYCENTPTYEQLSKSIGELFLGTYSFNGSPKRLDGIDFNTRPTSLTFNYTYSSYNDEVGFVYIKLYDSEGELISQNEKDLQKTTSENSLTLSLGGYPFNKKAAKIELSFKSSKGEPSIKIPTGSELDEGFKETTFVANEKKKANDFVTFAKGSELKIANVHFEY